MTAPFREGPPFWCVYIVQTDVVRRVIGEGHSRREALRDAASYARAA